jgi:beta-aspartyl-peptidase (threonine type)
LSCALAIHGGAGTIRRGNGAPARAALARSLEAGYAILWQGGSSLDAAVAAVAVMEDSALFNAGRGSVQTRDARYELDAAVMEGATRRAGAVACVSRIRNPVLAARAVMDHSPHVLLAGAGAERFARGQRLRMIPSSYFVTLKHKTPHGTVGAVALDRHGNLAAATSTGGVGGKLPGRVGDSPLVGAGIYADNRACAVSGTGLGEVFIRAALAYEVVARMRHRGETLARAASAALMEIKKLGGDGGLIAVDRRGNIAMPFNSAGMYRGCIDPRGRRAIALHR